MHNPKDKFPLNFFEVPLHGTHCVHALMKNGIKLTLHGTSCGHTWMNLRKMKFISHKKMLYCPIIRVSYHNTSSHLVKVEFRYKFFFFLENLYTYPVSNEVITEIKI